MHTIYRVLLFIAYFGILINCQGSGGGGGGRRGVVYHGGPSCTSNTCSILGSIAGGIVFVVVLVNCIIFCCKCCRGRPLQKNSTFINTINSKQLKQDAYDVNVFQSGIWSSRYFQDGRWHGPYQFSLSFDPQSMKVTGSGSDDVGTFSVDGTYSIKSGRMGLIKTYQAFTGNQSENLGHQVTIKLEWNAQNNQFESKWYTQTNKYRGVDKFELKLDQQHISVYEKV